MIQRDRAGECRETDIKNSEKHSAVNTVVYNETKQSHRNRIDSANRALRILDADRQNSIVESTKRYGKIVSPLQMSTFKATLCVPLISFVNGISSLISAFYC
ncbi:hypothetical protein [Paenibacillus pseudetheri]|uniref:Uncharacterized protein n=1 Tax=Paenibacillus pseudetheri TaxID=2897682 RepID=A0ABN8FNN2_9BACL|nr:hypothetical protein [Paenibacillus pseudetheri]CAH1058027.1 hypothetical protein PAECIP111894_04200 [Paenibacillus pseudetheri]